MRVPVVRGVIDRRILVNYRVDAGVMQSALPSPFRPKLVKGFAIGGICLIRLKDIRPAFWPLPFGIGSENAAHRIAVEWDQDGETKQGVYIPRRDTSSRLNVLLGGRVFPGVHHLASFDVKEQGNEYAVTLASGDGVTHMHVSGGVSDRLPEDSVFDSLDEVSAFFEAGSLGFSARPDGAWLEGLELRCQDWSVKPLAVDAVRSSYFDDPTRFPVGSVKPEVALLMRGIKHTWHSREPMCCG